MNQAHLEGAGARILTAWVAALAALEDQPMNVGPILQRHGRHHAAGHSAQPRGPSGRCFANSQETLLTPVMRDGWSYAEGFAIHGHDLIQGPTLHAWLVDDDGRVLDTTWPDPDRCSYFGIRFPEDFLHAALMRNGMGSLLFARNFDPPQLWRDLEDELAALQPREG